MNVSDYGHEIKTVSRLACRGNIGVNDAISSYVNIYLMRHLASWLGNIILSGESSLIGLDERRLTRDLLLALGQQMQMKGFDKKPTLSEICISFYLLWACLQACLPLVRRISKLICLLHG